MLQIVSTGVKKSLLILKLVLKQYPLHQAFIGQSQHLFPDIESKLCENIYKYGFSSLQSISLSLLNIKSQAL